VQTSWSEARVRRLLQTEDFAYQDIALPYGLSTGGADRSATARRIFPDDLRDKSVLDLGAKFGYFCFEAARRGAKRVVGVDVDPDSVRKARLLADCLGAEVRFEQLDVEATQVRERFDYVLCLNLLHHMKNPLAVLDQLVAATRDTLVLEVAGLGRHDRRKVGVSPLAAHFLDRAPIVFVSRNGTSGKRSVQKFFITPGAIENLLRHHRRIFARVETLPSDHKDRTLTIARRRRIDRLVAVAGPTAAGKSTLIAKLRRNQLPQIAARIGLGDGAAWRAGGSKEIAAMSEVHLPRLLFHYDFLRPYLRSAKVHGRDEGLDVLDTAESVTTLTLWCPPSRLRERLQRGEIAPRTILGLHWGPKRHRTLAADYRDPDAVRAHYRRWFAYLATRPGSHWVVSLEGGERILPVEAWEQLAAEVDR